MADTLTNIGVQYNDLDQPDQALEYYAQALSIKRKIGNRIGEAIVLNHVGTAHLDLGDSDQALEDFQASLEISAAAEAIIPQATSLHNIGSVYADRGQYDLARDYLRRALELSQEGGDPVSIAQTQLMIGTVYAEMQGYHSEALNYLRQALKNVVQTEAKWLEYDIRDSIVDIATETQDRDLVVQELSAMIELAERVRVRRCKSPALKFGKSWRSLGSGRHKQLQPK